MIIILPLSKYGDCHDDLFGVIPSKLSLPTSPPQSTCLVMVPEVVVAVEVVVVVAVVGMLVAAAPLQTAAQT